MNLNSYSFFIYFIVRRCSCGNCAEGLLVNAREYRCCKEIVEAGGKFLCIGLNVGCILDHPDFNAMTNETVLCQVGPLLRNKNGNPYKVKNGERQKYVLTKLM